MGIYCCSRQPRHRTINIGITTLVHISNDGWHQHKTTPDNSEEFVVTPNIGGLLLIRSPWHHGGYTWLVAYIWTTSVSFCTVRVDQRRVETSEDDYTTLQPRFFLSSLALVQVICFYQRSRVKYEHKTQATTDSRVMASDSCCALDARAQHYPSSIGWGHFHLPTAFSLCILPLSRRVGQLC